MTERTGVGDNIAALQPSTAISCVFVTTTRKDLENQEFQYLALLDDRERIIVTYVSGYYTFLGYAVTQIIYLKLVLA